VSYGTKIVCGEVAEGRLPPKGESTEATWLGGRKKAPWGKNYKLRNTAKEPSLLSASAGTREDAEKEYGRQLEKVIPFQAGGKGLIKSRSRQGACKKKGGIGNIPKEPYEICRPEAGVGVLKL